MISWRMAGAWLGAVLLTTVVTWQIVGLADSQTGLAPAAVAAPTSTLIANTTTTTSPTSTSTGDPVTTTSTPGTTTSDSADKTASSSSTSTTSTTLGTEWNVQTVSSAGGSVVVRHRPEEVELQAATPAPGFRVEIDDAGPDRVRVEFESDAIRVRVEVRWRGGALSVNIDEKD